MMKTTLTLTLAATASARTYKSEVFTQAQTEAAGFVHRGNATVRSSHDVLEAPAVTPSDFSWCAHPDGNSYCTMSRNQHIPQYCGSCWAHGSVSALADRVKISRRAVGADINPSVQHILNCQGGGSCHGGSVDGPYQWLYQLGESTGAGISLETSNPYMACSSEMTSGICPSGEWTCEPINVARTCSTFTEYGGDCAAITPYPNIMISDYGSISGSAAMQKEILANGPIACGIDASPILEYTTGIATDAGSGIDHVISVVGWGEEDGQSYWQVRNSWGEYWGEFGYVRVAFGALHIEDQCSWATVGSYTAPELANQAHCYEDGSECVAANATAL